MDLKIKQKKKMMMKKCAALRYFFLRTFRHVPSRRISHRNGQNHFVLAQKNLRFIVSFSFALQHISSEQTKEAREPIFWLFTSVHLKP